MLKLKVAYHVLMTAKNLDLWRDQKDRRRLPKRAPRGRLGARLRRSKSLWAFRTQSRVDVCPLGARLQKNIVSRIRQSLTLSNISELLQFTTAQQAAADFC